MPKGSRIKTANTERASRSIFLRVLPYLAVAVSAVPLVQFLLISVSRVSYPLDVEWMEGALLGHGIELLKTGSIYKLPSQDFVPFIYPPLYLYVMALGIKLFGIGYTFSRLVSVLSVLATSALLAWIIWKEVRNRVLAAVAFLSPFAVYGVTGYWFDLVRVDSLALLLVVAALVLLLYGPKRGGANLIACACLLALATFGKQSFLLFGVAVAIHLAVSRRWWALAVFGAVSVVFHGILWGGLVLEEGGIALVYILEVPRTHGWWGRGAGAAFGLALKNLFHFQPVLTALSVAVFLAAWGRVSGRAREKLQLFGLLSAAAVVISLTTRAKWGGYENAYIPTYSFLVLLGCHALGATVRSLEGVTDPPGIGEGEPRQPSGRTALWTLFLVMVLASNGLSAWGIDVRGQRVGAGRRLAAVQLTALLEAIDGRVLFPSRNAAVLTQNSDQNHYHTMAVRDLGSYPELLEVFQRDNEEGFRSGEFEAVITEFPVPSLESVFGYQRITLDNLGIRSDELGSITGKETCPRMLYYRGGVDLERLKRAVRSQSAEY